MTCHDGLLGKYYAAKIRGATELALYRATRGTQHQEAAIRHLQTAAEHWSAYSLRAGATYGPRFWTNRVGHVDWENSRARFSTMSKSLARRYLDRTRTSGLAGRC